MIILVKLRLKIIDRCLELMLLRSKFKLLLSCNFWMNSRFSFFYLMEILWRFLCMGNWFWSWRESRFFSLLNLRFQVLDFSLLFKNDWLIFVFIFLVNFFWFLSNSGINCFCKPALKIFKINFSSVGNFINFWENAVVELWDVSSQSLLNFMNSLNKWSKTLLVGYDLRFKGIVNIVDFVIKIFLVSFLLSIKIIVSLDDFLSDISFSLLNLVFKWISLIS